MKDTLYSREHMSEIHDELRSPLVPSKDDKLDVGWSDSKIPTLSIDSPPVFTPAKKRFSFGAKFLFGAILFFVLATGAASYIFFVGGNTISPQNIDIQVLAPSVIDGGSPTTFQVIVNNRNQTFAVSRYVCGLSRQYKRPC